MKVMLIQPPSSYHRETYPLGLAYIGAILEKSNCTVKAIDGSARYSFLNVEDVFSEVRKFSPDIICITLVINMVREGYRLAKELSKLNVPLIGGGPHANLMPHELLRHNFDIVVRGEGEDTVKEIVEYCYGNKALSDISGISYLDKSGRIMDNPDRSFIEDIDTIPFPARHLFPLSNYVTSSSSLTDEYWTILSSRGCPRQCIYCASAQGVFGKKYRFRSAENLIEELLLLKNEYGMRHIKFYDDTLTTHQTRLEKICDLMVEKDLDIRWICDSRVDCLNPELLSKMKKAGCHHIFFGVESYDRQTLQKIKKGITPEKIKQAIDWTIAEDMEVTTYLIFGWPWEGCSHINNTLKYLKSIPRHVRLEFGCFVPVPYPGTELYESNYKKYGFGDWWLSMDAFEESYDDSGYLPYFRANMPYLDHFYLKKNFFKHTHSFQKYLQKSFVVIGRLQNIRVYGVIKAFLIEQLSRLSLFFYRIDPVIECRIFKFLWSNNIRGNIKKMLKI